MDKHFFPDVSDEERLDLLKTNCSKLLEDYGYEKPLSKEQVVYDPLKDKNED